MTADLRVVGIFLLLRTFKLFFCDHKPASFWYFSVSADPRLFGMLPHFAFCFWSKSKQLSNAKGEEELGKQDDRCKPNTNANNTVSNCGCLQ